MRSHAKAPSARSIRIATVAALLAALLVLAFAAAPAPAAIFYVGTEPATEVQKDSAALNGYLGNDGKEAHYYFEWGETEAYGQTTPAPPGDATPGGYQPVAPILISGLAPGTTYHYRLVVSDPDGTATGGDVSFTTVPPIDNLTADPASAITGTSAELNASFDGDGASETHYYFEWGPSTAYGNTTPLPPGNGIAAGSGRIHLPPVAISGLEIGATYHYRVVASNPEGIARSADARFKTAEAPIVSNVHTASVTANSAELLGNINPRLGATTYRFEWGSTATYGNSTPIPDGDAGTGNSSVPISVELEGLDSSITYHFRLVATNQYGTTTSPDQTFGFYPPACPNSQLRQETRSNDLPDCRAYELVTPSFAQGAEVLPSAGPTSGLATNPPRISYGVDFGTFPISSGEAPAALDDLYVSARTDSGWTQRYIGLPGSQVTFMGGPLGAVFPSTTQGIEPAYGLRGVQATPDLGRFVNYNWGFPGNVAWRSPGSNAPYVWDASANLLERWPTNLAQVPGGERFVGFPQASPDLSHFVFSSNLVFAEGGQASPGEVTCCFAAVSTQANWPRDYVYDNDIGTGTVKLASVRKDGTPFTGRAFNISDDGSRILMAEEATLRSVVMPTVAKEAVVGAKLTGPLLLRVDGDRTYEIAPGRDLEYVGSTAAGTSVYFTSKEQLTPDDHDSSRDLFVWRESAPDSLTRVSAGSDPTAGNSDECAPNQSWTAGCDVSAIRFNAHPGGGAPIGRGGNGYTDSFIASKSGDIYFESAEQLVGQRGESGERNLYLYREGSLHYVTTMRPESPVIRMQVSPDGAHMGFLTGSNLTDYNSAGRPEMYVYDAGSGRVICASCRPDGQPPVSDVLASQNGLFLTYDGRAFFSTADPLSPRDTNEGDDVYEFTEGKPRLITSGIGPTPDTVFNVQVIPGLIGVSANGTDVYFATADTLVTQDHNGAQWKIYDARTGGGFPAEREEPKCPSADECHGPGANPPALPPDRTSAGLGTPRKAKAHKIKKHNKAKGNRRHKPKKRAGRAKAKRHSGGGRQGGKHHG